jgi:hypothetical protein
VELTDHRHGFASRGTRPVRDHQMRSGRPRGRHRAGKEPLFSIPASTACIFAGFFMVRCSVVKQETETPFLWLIPDRRCVGAFLNAGRSAIRNIHSEDFRIISRPAWRRDLDCPHIVEDALPGIGIRITPESLQLRPPDSLAVDCLFYIGAIADRSFGTPVLVDVAPIRHREVVDQ